MDVNPYESPQGQAEPEWPTRVRPTWLEYPKAVGFIFVIASILFGVTALLVHFLIAMFY